MYKRCLGCMEQYEGEYRVCPHCGYAAGTAAEEAIHMEPGSILHDRYIVGKVLGFGGFGVTYIGWDGLLEQKVAIKEYLPSEFSTRMPGQSRVKVFGGEKSEQFHDGLMKFIEEAKHLAKFQNEPGIVKIFDSFEENGTAYIIMEYLDGETLTGYLEREGTVPEDRAVQMLLPVLESLRAVHEEGLLHRDIAPDNIFLTKDGEVKLIDFGASRYATTSYSRSLTVIIKPGYSPEEQYRSRGDQGSYTDVYALAATMYKMVTGQTPPDAMERRAKYENQNKDILVPPHKLKKGISAIRENAILNAMNVRIEDRTPDVDTFISELTAKTPAKRKYGKIKKIDVYAWPTWAKILLPSVLGVALLIGVLLMTGIISFPSVYSRDIYIPEDTVIVPALEGLNKDEAIALVEEHGLFAKTSGTFSSEYVPAGAIVLQTPNSGTYIKQRSTIALVVSSGTGVLLPVNGISTMPFVVWDTEEVAIEKLQTAGFALPSIELEYNELVSEGCVIDTSVEAGEEAPEGSTITIVISKGPEPIPMPNVIGKTARGAIDLLEGKGLLVSVEYEDSTSVSKDEVIGQSIQTGSIVKRGDNVAITVSEGTDYVKILSVTPSSVENKGDRATFTVTIKYSLNAKEQGIIYLGANTSREDTSHLQTQTIVSKGSGTVTLNMTITTARNWDTEIYVNLSEYPHSWSWSPIDWTTYRITTENG